MMKSLQLAAATINIRLSPAQLEKFNIYVQVLRTWNQHTNLTRITDSQAIISKHFLDSLTCFLAVPTLPDRVIDVGTGAGFPGIVLKIVQPSIHLTLVEATGKKVRFLAHLVEALDLKQVTLINARAETVGHQPDHRAQYDLAVARAVAPLAVLAEYLLPLLRLNGWMLAQKGPTSADELQIAKNALTTLGGAHKQTIPVTLPQEGIRHLLMIQKVKPTPSKYPRRPGMPTKKPIY